MAYTSGSYMDIVFISILLIVFIFMLIKLSYKAYYDTSIRNTTESIIDILINIFGVLITTALLYNNFKNRPFTNRGINNIFWEERLINNTHQDDIDAHKKSETFNWRNHYGDIEGSYPIYNRPQELPETNTFSSPNIKPTHGKQTMI